MVLGNIQLFLFVCFFVDLLVFEVGVGNDQLVFCADGLQQIVLGISLPRSKLTEKLQPSIM